MTILGALFLAGIYYQTGTLINVINSTLYNVTKVYSPYSRVFTGFGGHTFDFSEIWGILLMFIGVGMVILAGVASSVGKKKVEVGEDE